MPVAPSWTRVARAADVAGDGPYAVAAGDVDLVLLRAGGSLRAYEGRCPHQGALLGEGELEGATLVCRNHRWRFDAATGKRAGGPQCLRSCPVRQDGEQILVDTSSLGAARPEARPARSVRDLPGPRPLPLVGNLFQLDLPRIHQILEEWALKFGPVYRFYMGPRPVLVVAEPTLVAEVLRRRPETYRKIENLEPIFKELGSAGVFSAEGREWRPQRKLAMEALALRHLRGFFPKLRQVAARLKRRWQRVAASGETVDLKDDLMRFTVDVTTSLVFGTDTNTLERDDDIIQRHLSLIFPAFARRLFAPFPLWRWLRLPADRRVDRAVAEVRKWVATLIAEARARVAADTPPGNFLEAMVLARDDDGRPFSDELITANAMTMLLAGEDTTALSVAWAAHHLCERPDAVGALQAELDGAVDADGIPADVEAVNRLTYTGAVASETMRLRPVAPMFFNASVQDTQLGDVAVPAGTAVMTLLRSASLDEANFPRASEFRPERWLAGALQGAAVSVPFGSGPRICPGRSLALVEMKVLLSLLYRGFDVERVGDASAVRERYSFTVMPEGLKVRLRARAPS